MTETVMDVLVLRRRFFDARKHDSSSRNLLNVDHMHALDGRKDIAAWSLCKG